MNNAHSPWRSHSKVGIGDQGQRYEVRYKDGAGQERTFGWAGTPAGAQLMVDSINRHPVWNSPRIVDRETNKKGEGT